MAAWQSHAIVRRYVELARAEFRRYSTYRLAMLAGIFTNTIFGFIRGSVLVGALVGAGGVIAGYDAKLALSYVWIGQALIAPIGLWVRREVADRVKSGDIAIDLARPLDFQLSWWARDMGRFVLGVPTRGLPTLLLGMILVGIAWPADWTAYPLGVLSLLLGTSINFLCMYAMNLISLWTVDVQGYLNLYGLALNLLSGFLIPVHIFPGWLLMVADHSPFPSIFQSPVDILSGRTGGWGAVQLIGTQSLWLTAIIVLSRLMLWRGSRRLVVQGG